MQGEKTGGGNKAPVTRFTTGALLSYEHQGRDKLRRTGPLQQPSALYLGLEATGF